jgi:hypothetical protein
MPRYCVATDGAEGLGLVPPDRERCSISAMHRIVRPVLSPTLLVLLACAGCAPSPAGEASASRMAPEAVAEVEKPPKELVEELKRVVAAPPLSLGVEETGKGTLVTGWKRHRGDWHIGRHWQERTRYRVEVSPDWDEPTRRSRLRVTAETEQRAAEGQRWDREPRMPRPQRARRVLDEILRQLRGEPAPVVSGISFGV